MAEDNLGSAVLRLTTDTSALLKGLKEAQSASKKFESGLSGVVSGIKGLLGGLTIGFVAKQFLDATIEAQHAEALLANAVRATGQAAGFTADQLKLQAAALQDVTAFSDEAIMSVQTRLLAFRNVSGEAFTRATKLALDFAAATGTDAASAAKTLGLALNEPAEGMGRLSRAGVSLSEETKRQVTLFMQQGQAGKAQALLLDELAKSYGGAAAAARNTLGGALEALKNKFGDLFLEIKGPASEIMVTWVNLVTANLGKARAVFDGFFAGVKAAIEQVVERVFFLGQGLVKLAQGDLQGAMRAFTEVKSVADNVAIAITASANAYTITTQAISNMEAKALSAGTTIPANLAKIQPTSEQLAASMAASQGRIALMFENNAAAIQRSSDIQLQKAQELDQAMEATKLQTSSTMGSMAASFAKGEMSTRQFVARMLIEIAKLIAKILLLKAVSAFAPPGVGKLIGGFGQAFIGGFAEGGRPPVGQPSIVGEAGPELFVPDVSGTIVPMDEKNMGGQKIVQNFTLTGVDLSDSATARKLMAKMAAEMKAGVVDAITMARASSDLSLAKARRAV